MSRADIYQAKAVLSSRLLTRATVGGAFEQAAPAAMLAVRPLAATVRPPVLARAVHGVGVGRKITLGKLTKTLAVRLYVPVKFPMRNLSPRDMLPAQIDGVPTDVVEAPPPVLMQALVNRELHRPLKPGVSIGNALIRAGTLACFCRSVRAGDDPTLIYMLSNNHVLAVNDRLAPPAAIIQPGTLDGPPPYQMVARLARAVPVVRGGAMPGNPIDAAIALVVGGTRLSRSVLGIGRIAGSAAVGEDDLVCKSGRTTGVTHGRIDDESVDELVGLDPNDRSLVARFRNQLRIVRAPAPAGRQDDGDTEFGRPGDSGSLVLTAEKSPRAAGLYFAGATGYGLANPIAAVLQGLQIELL